MTPCVSIIMPLYNGERHLRAALDSIVAQTAGDFECLCIDDGGKDASADIASEYARRDPRFSVVRQANAGVAVTRNRGLDLARGEFVAFLDQDDLLHPQFLEILLATIRRHGADFAACRSHDFLSDEGPGERLGPIERRADAVDFTSATPMEDFLFRTSSTPLMHAVWARLYRKSALAGCRFPDGLYGADDYVFTVRLMHVTRSYCVVPEDLHFHRTHPDNVTSAMPMRYILAMLDGIAMVADELFGDTRPYPLSAYAKSAVKHVQHWGLLLPCLKPYSRGEVRALSAKLRELRRRRILVFYSAGHALRYCLVTHGFFAPVRRLWPKLFAKMTR